MPHNEKIVLAIGVSDNADILREVIEWYFHLGVDFIVSYDCASTDGSQDILEEYARKRLLHWAPLPDNNYTRFNIFTNLGHLAREFGADWIIVCDTDEFVVPTRASLREMLVRAQNEDMTAINIPRFCMTGAPLPSGASAPEMLTLRIDRGTGVNSEQVLTWNLPAPYVFIRQPPKTIVRASALVNYASGAHAAAPSHGRIGKLPGLHCLHYPVRSYPTFMTKVGNVAAWLEGNPELGKRAAWHWRRWVQLHRAGRLREDYDAQFVSPSRAAELIRDGICSIDSTVSNWIKTAR